MSSSSNETIAIHAVDSDDDPRAICNGEPFVLSEVSGSGVLVPCPDCEAVIENGVEVNGKHYSYTVQDQSNMLNAMNLAKETGMEVPYHADGESCSLYDYGAISAIYIQETMNLTTNQTYFNQLKLYILSISDVDKTDDIAAIKYGDKLTGEFLNKYNEIMSQSKKIVEKVVTLNA